MVIFLHCGVGDFELFPATTAMFAVTRKLIIGEKNFKIFSSFPELFQTGFHES